MAGLAISLLWLLIGAIILAGVIWLVLYGVKTFITPIPQKLEAGSGSSSCPPYHLRDHRFRQRQRFAPV
jgi:hypothetical protein